MFCSVENRASARVTRKCCARPRPPVVLPFVALAFAAAAPPAFGSAFFVREQSAPALGNAFTGATAGGDDASYMFFNGASLTRLAGSSITVVGSIVDGYGKFRNGDASTFVGTPISGGDGGRNGGKTNFVPAAYGVLDLAPITAENIKLGLAVTSPFGLETEYTDGWVGRYYAQHSQLRTANFNPVVAWEALPGVSLAVGLQAQYLWSELSNAIDYGSVGAAFGIPGAVPGAQDGQGKVSGDDWAFGYTAGLLFQPLPSTRIGLAYRSAMRHEIDGNGRFRLDGAGIGAALGAPSGTYAAHAKSTLPDMASLGLHHQLDPDWSVMGEVSWMRWSRQRTLRVSFDDPSVPDDFTEQDWRDTFFFGAGASWRASETWTLRSGMAYDQSPVRNKTRSPRTPANSGILLAFGADWRPWENIALSAGYAHFFIESARIDLDQSAPGNATRGSLSGSSSNSVDSFALQLSWTF